MYDLYLIRVEYGENYEDRYVVVAYSEKDAIQRVQETISGDKLSKSGDIIIEREAKTTVGVKFVMTEQGG